MTAHHYLRAAMYLDQYADEIFCSETLSGRWPNASRDAVGRKAKREHDELRKLAQELRIEGKGRA
jgi:hypothetical protein